MKATGFSFDAQGATTSALFYPSSPANGQSRAVLLLAHGAGAPQTHPWMVAVARAVSARHLDVVTFNFLYMQASRRTPDRNDVLEATFRAAIEAVRTRSEVARSRLFIGGKSMGGRIATQVAAAADSSEGRLEVAGLVLLGYPLHPPGKPERLRSAHLPRVRAPMLFVQGSRDTFGTPAELAPALADVGPRARLFVVEGGDHSLATGKRGGVTLEATLDRVADEIARFIG